MLDTFFEAYVTAALWSSNDNADESGGEPLDANYSVDDIHPDTLAKMRADCEAFIKKCKRFVDEKYLNTHSCSAVERAGHDFWLTRCGHGAGFWDGDWKQPAARTMTSVSEKFGNVDLEVGDDKKIHYF